MSLNKSNANYIADIKQIVSDAKAHVYSVVNSTMVKSYWLIGKRIVEEEQEGKERADYGKEIIKTVSSELKEEFGRGFSTTNIRYFRNFYQIFPFDSIGHLASDEFKNTIRHLPSGEFKAGYVPSTPLRHRITSTGQLLSLSICKRSLSVAEKRSLSVVSERSSRESRKAVVERSRNESGNIKIKF